VNPNGTTKKPDISRIINEDILRILGEQKGKVPLRYLKTKIRVSSSSISEAIMSLQKEDLVAAENGSIGLTKKGRDAAKDIVKKHRWLEKYFQEGRSTRDAHRSAHLLEHHISMAVINNLKRIATLKKEGVPLTRFGFRKGVVTDITLSDYKLLERLISMGIIPGEVVEVTHEIPSGVVVTINNKQIVVDKTIANEIKVLEYEPS
jgi:Mn-dependent DtxR family transcriptional regulator/Fe2+ transport system protein FeoA